METKRKELNGDFTLTTVYSIPERNFKNKSLIILACQIVLQIDIRSDNKIVLSDRKALLVSRVAFIFDRGWVTV